MEENVIQINGGISTNVDVSVKNVTYSKKIIFGNLLHIAVKMENSQHIGITDDSAILCDEIIESYNEEIILIKRNKSAKCKISIFYLHFY